MNEIRESKDTIIFIDELHTIVGAGGAEGAIDASNMLKPALARGELQCIGATTLDEYRKYIEKDGALERRFQPIMVDPPIGGRDDRDHHGAARQVRGAPRRQDHRRGGASPRSSSPIATSTTASCPDKAIDVIDEAGARARLSVSTIPTEIARARDEDRAGRPRRRRPPSRRRSSRRRPSCRDREKELPRASSSELKQELERDQARQGGRGRRGRHRRGGRRR